MRKFFFSLLSLCLLAPLASAQQVKVTSFTTSQGQTYFKGRVIRDPAAHKALFEANVKAHAHVRKAIPHVTARKYDAADFGLVGPIKDQGQCGSCWLHSGVEVAETALIKAGWFDNSGKVTLSTQFGLDCPPSGGCNGDDNTTALAWIKAGGNPSTADYGPYTASAGQCKNTASMTMYKIKDWMFVDGQGVGDTQKIKDAIVKYGCVGCAVAAGGSDFWNTGQGTDTGTSTQIDHDVVLDGWDDDHDNGDGSKGAWIMRNSWNVTWGSLKGRAWMKYGADSIGTEPVVAWADPGPNPPQPGVPVISSAAAASVQVGAPFSYQIVASNTPTMYGGSDFPVGLTCNVTTGLVSGTVATAGSYTFTVSATNAAGTGTQPVVLTVGGPAPSPVGNVSINLTPDQVQSVITQSGAIVINGDMTVRQLLDALQKCKEPTKYTPPVKPCCGQQSKADFTERIKAAYLVETQPVSLNQLAELYEGAGPLPFESTTWDDLFKGFDKRANELKVAGKAPKVESVIQDEALATMPQSATVSAAMTNADRLAVRRFYRQVAAALRGAN